ncbi:MAG: tetratricopeptide repeat protein, partial [Thermoplasmata archaeon]
GFEDAWYRIGELLRKQNDHKKAEECFSWVLEINPNNIRAKKALLTLTEGNEYLHGERQNLQNTNRRGKQKAKLRRVRRKRGKTFIKIIEENPLDEVLKADIRMSEDELVAEALSGLESLVSQENAPQEEDLSAQYEDISADLDELVNLLGQKSAHLNEEIVEHIQSGEVRSDVNRAGDTQPNGFLLDTQGVIDVIPDERLMYIEDVNDMVADEVSVDKLIIVGRNHLEKKEFEKALVSFNRALELDPQNLDAWIAKEDVLLEMGKIAGASSCYKMGVVSPLESINAEGDDENSMQGRTGKEWRDTLISFLENIFGNSEGGKEPNFECPNCGSKINLDEKLCSGCNTTFLEEDLKNNQHGIDNLIFFGRLLRLLSVKIPTFIHFDNVHGCIKFLEKRKDDITGKFDFVIVRGEIEKLSNDINLKREA